MKLCTSSLDNNNQEIERTTFLYLPQVFNWTDTLTNTHANEKKNEKCP